jgi:hypothetical protein
MSKKDEVKRLVKAVESDNFEEECENQGFTICQSAEESKSKKKCNI